MAAATLAYCSTKHFQHVGTAGATVILLAIYAVSLLYITNFQLKDWAMRCGRNGSCVALIDRPSGRRGSGADQKRG